jgi:hypothetical protein
MIGSKSNDGQVLLLLIMVLGTLLIVAMTAIFQSSTDTQISGTNQLSQTTLSASEAGLEKGLLDGTSGTFAELGITNLTNIDLNNSRVEIAQPRYSEFTSQRMDADSQYTFYLADYDPTTATFGSPYALNFKTFYESPNQTCSDIVLELTFVYDQNNDGNYETAKKIVDAGDKLTTNNTNDLFDITSGVIAANDTTGVVNNYRFQCQTVEIDVGQYTNAKFVMIQNYLNGTKLGFKATNSAQIPPQGKIITSTARAKATSGVSVSGSPTPIPQTGLTRVTQIFQSYPQIPSEFWTTSF